MLANSYIHAYSRTRVRFNLINGKILIMYCKQCLTLTGPHAYVHEDVVICMPRTF